MCGKHFCMKLARLGRDRAHPQPDRGACPGVPRTPRVEPLNSHTHFPATFVPSTICTATDHTARFNLSTTSHGTLHLLGLDAELPNTNIFYICYKQKSRLHHWWKVSFSEAREVGQGSCSFTTRSGGLSRAQFAPQKAKRRAATCQQRSSPPRLDAELANTRQGSCSSTTPSGGWTRPTRACCSPASNSSPPHTDTPSRERQRVQLFFP